MPQLGKPYPHISPPEERIREPTLDGLKFRCCLNDPCGEAWKIDQVGQAVCGLCTDEPLWKLHLIARLIHREREAVLTGYSTEIRRQRIEYLFRHSSADAYCHVQTPGVIHQTRIGIVNAK